MQENKIRNQGIIVSVNGEGLGNRIKCWVNSQAEDPGARLYWPNNNIMSCEFRDLFIEDELIVNSIPAHAITRSNWRLTSFPRHLLRDGFATYRGHSYTDGRAIDFEYQRIPSEIKSIFVPLFLKLQPNSTVNDQIELTSHLFDDTTVSVHVRTWVDAPNRAYKFNRDGYFRLMERYPTSKFFVACDSAEELQRFKKQFPERIIEHPSRLPLTKTEKFQHALTEMYLLSRNDTIIASYASTFGEVAWWLGGARADVLVVPMKDINLGVDEVNGMARFLFRSKRKLKNIFGSS